MHARRQLPPFEFELPLVVALLQGRAVGVAIPEVDVVNLRIPARVAAFLADVNLAASLLVGVRELYSVDLAAMGLQGATLSEGLVAQFALVRSHS